MEDATEKGVTVSSKQGVKNKHLRCVCVCVWGGSGWKIWGQEWGYKTERSVEGDQKLLPWQQMAADAGDARGKVGGRGFLIKVWSCQTHQKNIHGMLSTTPPHKAQIMHKHMLVMVQVLQMETD